MSKSVALFGGSFNPPHAGHREIVRRLARKKSIDEVWVLPVWRHPFGKKLPSFEKRVARCRRFFAKITPPSVKIKSYEKRAGASGFTVDLIAFLKRKFPGYRFYWVMGADTYREKGKWKDFRKVRREVSLIVFPRGPKSFIPPVSSTDLRRRRAP